MGSKKRPSAAECKEGRKEGRRQSSLKRVSTDHMGKEDGVPHANGLVWVCLAVLENVLDGGLAVGVLFDCAERKRELATGQLLHSRHLSPPLDDAHRHPHRKAGKRADEKKLSRTCHGALIRAFLFTMFLLCKVHK